MKRAAKCSKYTVQVTKLKTLLRVSTSRDKSIHDRLQLSCHISSDPTQCRHLTSSSMHVMLSLGC